MSHAWLMHTAEVPASPQPPVLRKNIDHGVLGANGERLVFYDPGQSLLMAPGDWLGTKLADRLHVQDSKGLRIWIVLGLVFLPLNVALVLTCYWTVRLLGFGQSLAALTGLVWLVGTTVLPYAQIHFQNNQVLLFALLSCALILYGQRHATERRWLLLSGAAAGMTFLIRTSAAIHVVTAGLFLLVCLRIDRIEPRDSLRRIGLWIAGTIPFVIADRLFDYFRYGSLFATGQSVWLRNLNSDPLFAGLPLMPANYPFVNPASEGILGVLSSPAKSIFIYDPLLLPCLIVGALAWRSLSPQSRALSALAILNLLMHMVLTAKLDFWHGDWAWGARYHQSSVDLLLVFLLPVFLQRVREAYSVKALALRGLVVLAIAAQLLAVAMPIGVEVMAEDLTEPVMCVNDEWNSKLGFRLGRRIDDLYCLRADAADRECPAQLAQRALERHPQCADRVATLRQFNHLAFFPFDPAHRLLGYGMELPLWCALMGLSVLSTSVWLGRGLRGGNARALRTEPSVT